jgi:hypothetical protein
MIPVTSGTWPAQVYISSTRPDKEFTFHPVQFTWLEAREYCRARGGDLATILDANEYAAMRDKLPSGTWWLGLNDIAQEGTFVWADGEQSGFTDFGAGEPNNNLGIEDCVAFNWRLPGAGSEWNDLPCYTAENQAYPICARYGHEANHTNQTSTLSSEVIARNQCIPPVII